MSKFLRVLGFAWAVPLTLLGLVYASAFTALGWYKRLGTFGDALVWQLDIEKMPVWLSKMWFKWAGHTVGNVVVVRNDPTQTDIGRVTLVHEQAHVAQCARLGVFQPVLYFLAYLGLKLGCQHSDPYFDSPFEIDARRAAKQVIDVVGVTQKLRGRAQNIDK